MLYACVPVTVAPTSESKIVGVSSPRMPNATESEGLSGATGENSTPSRSPSRSERLKLKRSGSDSSVPGYYATLSGQKRKARSEGANEDDDGANAEALSALAKAPPKASVEKKKPSSRRSSGGATRRKEEETAAALLGLFRSDSGPGPSAGHILPTSPPTAALVQQENSAMHPGGMLATHVTALPYTFPQAQAGGAPPYPHSISGFSSYNAAAPAPKPKPALKRQRSQSSRKSEVPEEPLLDLKLPEGNGPWEGIVVTLRHGKYKGKSANVLGLAKKKYRVQVEGLDYQLEFYPSYVGLPEPPQPDENAEKSESEHLLKRTATNASATNIVLASASPSQLQRVASGSSEGSKGSKATQTNVTTSLESYRSWIGKTVLVKRGKYQGRSAWVLGLASEKLRVVVENVEHQLEYYPTMFEPPQQNNQRAPQSTSVHLAIGGAQPPSPPLNPAKPAALTRVASGASSGMPEQSSPQPIMQLVRTGSTLENAMPPSAKPPTPSKPVLSRCASSPPLLS